MSGIRFRNIIFSFVLGSQVSRSGASVVQPWLATLEHCKNSAEARGAKLDWDTHLIGGDLQRARDRAPGVGRHGRQRKLNITNILAQTGEKLKEELSTWKEQKVSSMFFTIQASSLVMFCQFDLSLHRRSSQRGNQSRACPQAAGSQGPQDHSLQQSGITMANTISLLSTWYKVCRDTFNFDNST